MTMNARTEAAIAEIYSLKPEEFESADINKLLANYGDISTPLVTKLYKWFKFGESSALQQRKFIELDESAVDVIGSSLAPATQKWLIESEADRSDDVYAMLVCLPKLETVSPALKQYALSAAESADPKAQKAILKFFGVRKVEDLPEASSRGRKPAKEERAPRQPRDKKEGVSGTRSIRSVKASMEANADNLAVIQIFGAPSAREAHNAAKEIEISDLKNSSVKRLVQAVAASRKSAEVEALKEKFAKRHADLLEQTGSADESKSDDKPIRPRTSLGEKKNAGLGVIEKVVGKAKKQDSSDSSSEEKRHHSHPRESERLVQGNKNPIVRRPNSRTPGKIQAAIRQVRRPA